MQIKEPIATLHPKEVNIGDESQLPGSKKKYWIIAILILLVIIGVVVYTSRAKQDEKD